MSPRLLAFSRFLLGVAVVLTANFLAARLAPEGGSLRRFDLVYRPLSLLFLLAGFSILLLGFHRPPGNPLAAMGLAMRGPWLRDLWIGTLLGAGMVTAAVTVVALAGTLTIKVAFNGYTARLAVVVLIILATGATAEELSFRGYPFQRLIDTVGPAAAVAVLSMFFGAVHLGNPHASLWGFVNTVLIGIVLALAYLRTRLLWMSIAIHFWWNATLGLIFGLPVSGLTEFSVITRARAQGPAWLTGGNYGIEASAAGTAIIALGLVLLVVFVRPRAGAAPTEVAPGRELPGAVAPAVSGEPFSASMADARDTEASSRRPETSSPEKSEDAGAT